MESKEFDLEDVLCVTTERMVSKRGIVAVYEVIEFVLGQSLMTHQIPDELRKAQAKIRKQYPLLAWEVPPVDVDGLNNWVDAMTTTHGKKVTLTR